MVDDLTVTIAAGATSGEGTFQLAPADDAVADPGETVTVSGTAGGFTFTNATLANQRHRHRSDGDCAEPQPGRRGRRCQRDGHGDRDASPSSITLPDATVVTVAVGGRRRFGH